MKKFTKVNKTIILSALSALAFGGVAVGSTYALFTSKAETNITVSTGKVDVQSKIDSLATYSGVNLTGNPETDVLEATSTVGEFTNGGTATITGNIIKLDNMTPGDKAEFKVIIHNNSTVKSMYRTVVSSSNDTGLFNGLIVKIDDEELAGSKIKTDYKDLEVGSADIEIKVSVELPSDASDIYQEKSCKLSFTAEAIQGNAFKGIYEVTPENIQSYLDGEMGSIDNCTIVLTEGTYPELQLGRATKEAGSNTDYYLGGISSENKKTYEELVELKNDGSSLSPYYVRNMTNVVFKAKTGANVTVAGINTTAGHIYGTEENPVHDYVLNYDTTSTSPSYYLAENWNNISFEGIKFISNVSIASSLEETKIDGVSFKNCTFTPGDSSTYTTNNSKYYGIRYYNEINNEAMKNLVVSNCEFKYCFHAIYGMHIKGMTIINSSFDTIGYNAIQNTVIGTNAANQGLMKIRNNTFTNGKDRIIRLGYVGADTQYIIKGNKASNFSDGSSVMKASNLAEGITYDIANNDWGAGTTIVNPELEDK